MTNFIIVILHKIAQLCNFAKKYRSRIKLCPQ